MTFLYKNIVFDLGGVLVDFSPLEFLVDHFMNEKLEKELYDITFGSKEWRMLDAGEITRQEANCAMLAKGAEIGHIFEVEAILSDWMDMLKTKEDTVQLIRKLHKRHYRIFYLSNIPEDVFNLLSKRKFLQYFEGGIASYEVNITKPDQRIYKALLDKYGLIAEETIFTDDNKINAAAAQDAQITGIHFKGVKSFAKALDSYGVITERKRTAPRSERKPTTTPDDKK